MAKVSVTKEKLDTLAGKIATKSGESTPMTIDEMGAAVDSITPGGGGTYQTKTKTYTPTTSQQSETISADVGYDALSSVSVTVSAMPSGSEGTPTATKGAVADHSIDVTPSVTNSAGYIEGGTKAGTPVTVTVAELVSGALGLATNGTFDVTNYKNAVVDVPDIPLLATVSLGSISTSSTSAADTGKTVSVEGVNNYDMLIAVTACTKTNNRHLATINAIMLAGTSAIGTKNTASLANATINIKLSSAGAASSRAGTTKYGIYVNTASISNGTVTLAMYQRYNSTSTGTINGTYTTKVYGVKLYEKI